MAYPIEELDPTTARPEEIQKAVEDTVQMLIQQEGLSQEDAIAKAQQLLQSLAQQPMANSRTSTNLTSGEFSRGGSMMGSSGASNGYQTVPNPVLNNRNPASYPRGSV